MPTNTKEYMREYQRIRRARLKEEKEKPLQPLPRIVKSDVKKIINSEIPVLESYEGSPVVEGKIEKSPLDSGSKLFIDFNRIANLSTFQRFIIEAIKISVPGYKGVPTRGKKEVMATEFNKRVSDYREVMKELKEKLKKRDLND